MNLLLTTSCNKNCSFCFAKDVLNPSHLTMDEFKKITDLHGPNSSIKLLGGEPTIAPIFLEALEYLKEEKFANMGIGIISNFLFKESTSKAIVDFCKSNSAFFLINVSESDDEQREIIVRNIRSLTNELKKTNMKIGFTLNDKLEFSYYKEMLEYFKDKVGYAIDIRVSLPFPNQETYNGNFYLYKNYKYIEQIKEFIEWSKENRVKINLDCGIYPCMIKDEDEEVFLRDNLLNFSYGCASFGSPSDVFKNGDVIHCYPGKSVKVNMKYHDSDISIRRELELRKRLALKTKKLPMECVSCDFLINKKCPGPCLGFIGYDK